MSGPPSVRLRVGVFGDTAAGKTALLASFFGSQQRYDTDKRLGYRLTAANVNDGNQLLRKYYEMQEGHFPASTALSRAHTYELDLKLAGQVRPAVRLEWVDYPGGWWSGSALDPNEREDQKRCILGLLEADVCLLLIDGDKFAQEAGRADYLRAQFKLFRQEIERWLAVAREAGRSPQVINKDWIIALTKADRLGKEYRAEDFCRAVIRHAHEQQAWLAALLNGADSGEVDVSRFGTRYMLLAAASGQGSRVFSVEETIGLDLLIPAVFRTAFLRLAGRQRQRTAGPPLTEFEQLMLAVIKPVLNRVAAEREPGHKPGLADFLNLFVNAASIPLEQRVKEHEQAHQQALKDGNTMEDFARPLDSALESKEGRRVFHISQF